MDKLNIIFNEICDYAEKIIENSTFIFEQESNIKLSIKDRELVDEIFKRRTDEYLHDSVSILQEKNKFKKYILEKKNVDIPFFKSVWKGDMYDIKGINALVKLRDDLKHKYENMNIETFVKFVNI